MGLILFSGCTKTIEKIITAETDGSITGRVVQADSGAWVVIGQAEPVDSVQISPYNGTFLLENVPAGNYDLIVKAGNYGTYRRADVEVTGGARTYVGEIRLSDFPDLISQVYPADRSEIVFDRRWSQISISVEFVRPMNRQSVEAAFSTDPPSEGVFYWGAFAYTPTPRYYWNDESLYARDSGAGAVISTYENITSFTYRMAQKDGYVDTTYTVILATTAMDTAGSPLSFPLMFRFSTVQSATSQNVILTQPEHGAIYVNPLQNASIYVNFPRRMDAVSTESALTLSPPSDITPLWPERNQLRIFTGGPLRCETLYTIRIDGTATDLDGDALGDPFEFSFETAPLEVTNTRPLNGEIFVSRNVVISIQFNTYMNLAAVQNAFGIQPAVRGSFFRGWSYQENNTNPSKDVISFRPSQDLAGNTKYTITLGTGARDMHGSALKDPVTFSFVTESE